MTGGGRKRKAREGWIYSYCLIGHDAGVGVGIPVCQWICDEILRRMKEEK